MAATDFAGRFVETIKKDRAVRMIYGRLNVAREDFFSEALLVSYRPEPSQADLPATTRHGSLSGFSNWIYRGQTGYEVLKNVRWYLESVTLPALSSGVATRNTLMNEPVSNLLQADPRRTDILHEYFVAPDRFNEFIHGCRDIIPKARAEFLNVTLRYVKRDDTSVLAFAKQNCIASVMSFSQEMSPEGEADMIRTTERLIDLVGSLGGSFYLPYRLHARPDQLLNIYPGVQRFISLKRHYDRGLLFRNLMWDNYFAA
jgi:hypothetical protein